MFAFILALVLELWGVPELRATPQRITIMTYNVENLFDENHDPGKNDWAFLPQASKANVAHKKRCLRLSGKRQAECADLDWSHAAVESKLERLARVIKLPFGDRGPDILVLAEVENLGMAERLRALLPEAGFRAPHLIEGKDPRGIDIAVLSRFPLAAPARLHRKLKQLPHVRLSRGILEVPLRLDSGLIVRLFAVHFPAPYHPLKRRVEALRFLNILAESTRDPQAVQIAAGDFNVPKSDGDALYNSLMHPDWAISHLEDCKGCAGTYFLAKNRSWSFLDAIMIRRQAGRFSCSFAPNSVRVVATESLGFAVPSDHNPLAGELSCVPQAGGLLHDTPVPKKVYAP